MKNHNQFSQAGFTLLELMMAIAITGGIGIAVFQIIIGTTNLAKTNQTAGDLSQIHLNILDYLSKPNHCNANFYNKPTGNNLPLTKLNKCLGTGANCRTAGTAVTSYPITTNSWNQTDTGISNSLRIVSANYSVNSVTGTALATLRLNVQFERKKEELKSARTHSEIFSFPVVVQSTTIIGCPQSWNSTIPL